jgi:hypothetical protein
MSDVFGDTTDQEASPDVVARIAAIVASGIRGVNRTWPFRGGYFTV